jgi:hypothetical protein
MKRVDEVPVPKEMQHLKLDHRGYPIPFFVAMKDGKPDFRLLDAQKQKRCVDNHWCAVCGKKLPKDYFYFISGPIGMKNRVSSDPAMHRACAEYSLAVCPHLYLQKAERRDSDLTLSQLQQQLVEIEKPKEMFLIKASKYKMKVHANQPIIHYTYVSSEKYMYEDGKLKLWTTV